MNLATMQSMLGRIYDTPINFPVDNYLLTCRRQLPDAALPVDEQLLLMDEGDTVYVSLFVDAAVLARLRHTRHPFRLDSANLADWLTAIEGVSHFQYLTYHASYDRPVSLLELELQAEVDKYASCLMQLATQTPGRFPVELQPQLFSARYRTDPALGPELAQRYETATRGAARFSAKLETLVRRGQDWRAWVRALRRFYRWPLSRKLAFVNL